jgi:hypothetical protein
MSQRPDEHRDLDQCYDVLLAIDREALAESQYELAYHALAGALHCAEAARDEERVAHVAALVEEHRRRVDAEEPPHPISSAAAAARGHRSLFETLAGQAASLLARLRSTAAIERATQRPWPDREPELDKGSAP